MTDLSHPDVSVIKHLNRIWSNRRLAHAYLLVGPQDTGKTRTALALAQLVNCQSQASRPCGECSVCRKIGSGNHPDVHMIGTDAGESIKIEEIRFLLGRVHLKAFEAETKVFIIRNIELMTMEAANALLKALEEPAANTLMILTTSVPEDNLDTIKSRCHIIKFFPAPVGRVARLLADEGLKEQDARFLADYAEGFLGRSRRLMGMDILSTRREVLDEMLLSRQSERFFKEITQDPQKTSEALRLLYSFFRDVLLLKCGIAGSQDYRQEVERFAKRDMEDLVLIIRQIVQTRKLAGENLNVKMSLSLLKEYIWGN
jgi:DNA polymerase-3 subunit delta'